MQKTHLFLLLLFISSLVAAQQKSTIKHVKSNGGKIEVTQQNNSSTQESVIDSIAGDTIKIKVVQGDGIPASPKPSGFQGWISNTTNLIGLFVAIGTLIGMVWAVIQFLKKNRKRK